MSSGARKSATMFSVEALLTCGLGLILAWGWLTTGPSNQELLADYAKSKDLADLIWENKGFAWWTPNYLGGVSTAPWLEPPSPGFGFGSGGSPGIPWREEKSQASYVCFFRDC